MVTKEETVRSRVLGLRAGELVEVRSEAEILATLDEKGELDSLPFMPEMRQFCGGRFRVYKRAVKLCDTISWTGMYRMENAVHLEGVRCDGQAHGGCQAGCNTYWKEAWLRRVDADAQEPREPVAEATHLPGGAAPAGPPSGCTVDANNRNRGMSFDAEMLKYCGRQARVLRRVDRIIDEPSGRMMRLKNPCIILEDVICTSGVHRLCPRAIYPYWREIWLQRV